MIKIDFNDDGTMSVCLLNSDDTESKIYRVDNYEDTILARALLTQCPRDKVRYPLTFEYTGNDVGDVIKIRDSHGVVLDFYRDAAGLIFADYLENIIYRKSKENRRLNYTIQKRWNHDTGIVLDVYHLSEKTHVISNDLIRDKFCNFLSANFGIRSFNIVEIYEIDDFKFGVALDCQTYSRVTELTNSEVLYLYDVLEAGKIGKEKYDDSIYHILCPLGRMNVLYKYEDWQTPKVINIEPQLSKNIFNLINELCKDEVRHENNQCTTISFLKDDTSIKIDGKLIDNAHPNVIHKLYSLLNKKDGDQNG